ncbi:MAG TPA: DMT family transporter, partial [bacterium]|nr:DMT family transporter [bacterium]
GTLFSGLLLLVGLGSGALTLTGIPYYYFLGGCIGFLVVAGNNFAVPHLGTMLTTLIIVACQLVTSALMDHFGILGGETIPLSGLRIAGIVVIFLGAVLVFDNKSPQHHEGTEGFCGRGRN